MIDSRVIHEYMRAIEAGKLPPVECPIGNDHLPLISGYNAVKERWLFRCLTCDYALYLGSDAFDRMRTLLRTVDSID